MSIHRRRFLQAASAAACAASWPQIRAAGASSGTVFGANCYDLFVNHVFNDHGKRDPRTRLKELSDAGMRFVRFSASPFWPAEWQKLYLDNKSHYLKCLDDVFSAAADLKLQVVPGLFWCPISISDLNGEPYSAWADPKSKTTAFVHDYAQTIVSRYAKADVLCWELGNEMNLNLDLPIDKAFLPKLAVDQGTPSQRTARDVLTTAQYQTVVSQFQAFVQQASSSAKVSAGSDWPRWNATETHARVMAAHLAIDKPADKPSDTPDSADEHVQALQAANPRNGQFTSVHLYPEDAKKYTRSLSTVAELVKTAKAAATASGNKLLIGEFGLRSSHDQQADQARFDEIIAAIRGGGADYAALWNYDFAAQPEWNVTLTNERAWQLRAVGKANGKT